MAATPNKQEPVFELIRSMSKAEKRNFKLYATRLAGNQEAKFLTLFDCLDSLDEYDEKRILQRCPIKKEQLPNMKAHLYKQILVSIRLLDVQRTVPMQLREQIDFARILFDKGLYRQSSKLLDKAAELALPNEQYTMAIDIVEMQKKIETLNISRGILSKSESLSRLAGTMCDKIVRINDLSNISMQLYGLYLKLGYTRTQKDIDLIIQVYGQKLAKYEACDEGELSFTERFFLDQANAWYNYILHNLLLCYKYVCRWISLFDEHPHMKQLMYDAYLRGYSRLLDSLFLLRSHKRFVSTLRAFEKEIGEIGNISDNARMIALQILYTNRINNYFREGLFSDGIKIIPEVEEFIRNYSNQLDLHHRMVLYYKIACLYFGNGNYGPCMEYLKRIISTRDPQIRRDLQCYARILNLICSYESGIDYNIDYQIRSVYVFLVNDAFPQTAQHDLCRRPERGIPQTLRNPQAVRATSVRTADFLLSRRPFVAAKQGRRNPRSRSDPPPFPVRKQITPRRSRSFRFSQPVARSRFTACIAPVTHPLTSPDSPFPSLRLHLPDYLILPHPVRLLRSAGSAPPFPKSTGSERSVKIFPKKFYELQSGAIGPL